MSDDRDDTRLVAPRVLRVAALAASGGTTDGGDDGDTIILTGAVLSVTPAASDSPAVREAKPVAPVRTDYYRYRIGDHREPISLEVPSYVGRRPTAPRVTRGVPPRLVRVASPLREVSATHLEIQQLGSSVIVTDLRSTNGSVVMLPGSVPRKLRQGESIVVSPGTLVDIGDENILQILPMQRQTVAGRQP